MTLFIMDTDTLSLLQRTHPVVQQHFDAHRTDDIAITVITVEEQLAGWFTVLRRARQRDDLIRVYDQFAACIRSYVGLQLLSFPGPAIDRYDQLKAVRLNVGKNDLKIAAITLEFGGVLVTRNVRDFQRVPHLPLADWSQ